MIDALDEAADPLQLAEQLLRPLIERGRGTIWLLLGTRRHICEHLGCGWRDWCQFVDLDSPDYADPAALSTVVRRILTGARPAVEMQATATPFGSCLPSMVDAVTAAIADAAGNSFFVGRILAETQGISVRPTGSSDRTGGPACRRPPGLQCTGI